MKKWIEFRDLKYRKWNKGDYIEDIVDMTEGNICLYIVTKVLRKKPIIYIQCLGRNFIEQVIEPINLSIRLI